jgi:hypothetical protein
MGMDNGKTSLPLAEAAKQMGIPKEALRKRVLRKSIQAYKDGDGSSSLMVRCRSPRRSPQGYRHRISQSPRRSIPAIQLIRN